MSEDVVLTDELLELGKIISKNTLATLISCYQVMLPKALKAKKGRVVNKKFDIYYRGVGCDLEYDKLSLKQAEIINLFKERELILRKELVEVSVSALNTFR